MLRLNLLLAAKGLQSKNCRRTPKLSLDLVLLHRHVKLNVERGVHLKGYR